MEGDIEIEGDRGRCTTPLPACCAVADGLTHCVPHQVVYSGADILLVSDGELPDPPLDAPTHARLRRLQREQGFEVRACCLPADGLLFAC